MEINRTSGSVFKNIIFFSVPFFISYFLQTFYGLADLFIIGRFGTVAGTTAVSVGSQIMHMLTVMIVGLAMGATVMISRSVGEKNKEAAAKTVGNTAVLFIGLSVVATVILTLSAAPIVSLVSTPQEAADGAAEYLTVCFAGIPFITAYNVIAAVFRGMGDSKTPMYFVAAACLFNVGLDCLFMGAFGMGALGAALGTVISQTTSVIIAVIYTAAKKTGIKLNKSHFKLDKQTVKELFKIGVPVALQDGLIQVAFIAITVFANKRGLQDSAAVGIVEKIIGVVFLVPSTMLSAVSALASQNLGAGRRERAELTLKYALLITVSYGLAVALIVFFTAEPLISLFTESKEVTLLGGQYIKGYIWDTAFAGVHFCFSGYFCALKKSSLSFMHNFLSIVSVRLPVSYVASVRYADTLFPMGCAAPLGSLLSVIICVAAFFIIKKRYSPKKQI